MWENLSAKIISGNRKSLARGISLIENKLAGYEEMLAALPASSVPVTGITGPPGAGKSTIADCLINLLVADNKKVAVLCIDPSSPFHMGALLGDRIRMNRWYNTPEVFIRSLAGKDSLGGLSPQVTEVTELLKAAQFDHIIIETIGVGQNEIEICRLADIIVVVLVPEGGDEVQTMKAGLMEIADIFVVNKSDRAGADIFAQYLKNMLPPGDAHTIPVIKMTASANEGTSELLDVIYKTAEKHKNSGKQYLLLAEKAYRLIQNRRMADVNKKSLMEQIKKEPGINLYKFVNQF